MDKQKTIATETADRVAAGVAQPSVGLLWRSRCVAVCLTIIVSLVLLEAGLRITGRYRMSGLSGFQATGGLSYVLKTNVSKRIFWPGLSWTVFTSDLGFRAAQTGPTGIGQKPYYAVLGSSEVFGNGLDYQETFVGVLAEHMNRRHRVDVINLAMPGHHFMEQDVVFRNFTQSAARSPDVVLICLNPLFIGGYDDIHENVSVRLGELFDKTHWKLPLAKMVLANSLASYCFFRDSIRNTQAKYFPSKDFPLAFYVTRYSTRHRFRTPEKTQDFLQRLRKLEEYVRSLKATPVCVYFPTVGGFSLNDLKAKGELKDVEPFDTQFFVDLARKHCEAEGIQFINAEPLLQKMFDAGKTLNFRGDAHFNGPTSRVIGDYLYAELNPSSTNILSSALR